MKKPLITKQQEELIKKLINDYGTQDEFMYQHVDSKTSTTENQRLAWTSDEEQILNEISIRDMSLIVYDNYFEIKKTNEELVREIFLNVCLKTEVKIKMIVKLIEGENK